MTDCKTSPSKADFLVIVGNEKSTPTTTINDVAPNRGSIIANSSLEIYIYISMLFFIYNCLCFSR